MNLASDLFELMGFEVLEARESSPRFISIFEKEILPQRIRERFGGEHEGDFLETLLAFQKKRGFPMLDFSFMLAVRNPGFKAAARALKAA